MYLYVVSSFFVCLFLFVCSLLEIPSLAASDNRVGRSSISSEDFANAAAEAARTCHSGCSRAALFEKCAERRRRRRAFYFSFFCLINSPFCELIKLQFCAYVGRCVRPALFHLFVFRFDQRIILGDIYMSPTSFDLGKVRGVVKAYGSKVRGLH